MKKNIETQQWHTGMKSSSRTTMKTTMKHKNEKTTIIQQSLDNENQLSTPMKHENETKQ
jgi:hypothetical protein